MTTTDLNATIARVNRERADFYRSAWEGITPPADIQRAAERICDAYGIRGICDPGYIANVIALELGRGDGHSRFNEV